MDINSVLEKMSLNESVKDNITKAFNEAVELRATEIASSEIESSKADLNEMFNQKIEDIEQQYKDKFYEAEQDLIESKQKASKEYEEKLYEAYEEMKSFQNKLVESIDSYVETAVNEYVDEVRSKLESTLSTKKTETILEAFDAALTAAGVDILKITKQADKKLEESDKHIEERYAKVVKELNETKEELEKAIKLGTINELKSDLSLVESNKFEKVASMIPFEKSADYYNKLVDLKESLKSKTDSFEKPVEKEIKQNLNESTKIQDDFTARLSRLM